MAIFPANSLQIVVTFCLQSQNQLLYLVQGEDRVIEGIKHQGIVCTDLQIRYLPDNRQEFTWNIAYFLHPHSHDFCRQLMQFFHENGVGHIKIYASSSYNLLYIASFQVLSMMFNERDLEFTLLIQNMEFPEKHSDGTVCVEEWDPDFDPRSILIKDL